MVARSARTPVMTSEDCPGLTEIKNVRIRNNLLEEIFNVEDSIELDYFELERQEANFDNYLSGYSSPSNTRLELKQEEILPGRGFGVESYGYQLQELQNRRIGSKDSAGSVNQPNGLSVTRAGTYESSGRELVAVASPTISSTCEGALTGSVTSGVGSVPSGSPGAVAVSDTSSVHSTTNASGQDSIVSTDSKTVANQNQQGSNELRKVEAKSGIAQPVQGCSSRPNVRPRPESRSSRNVNTSQQVSGGSSLTRIEDISGDPAVTLSSSAGPVHGGDSTTASSSSTSPSQLHVTKRQRVIDCGSDLLAEVRQAYEYIQGADLYAPSSHPTFTNLDVAGVSTMFQPNTDRNGQPQMNFNFADQTGSVPVAFAANPQVGLKGSTGVPYVGSRSTASPSVVYQSCPDLASPGRPETVAFSRFVQQRPLTDDTAAASLSAPTTPSKRAGPWPANPRSPMSPSLQAPAAQWRPAVPVPGERNMPVPMTRQNVAVMNNGRNMLAYVPRDLQRAGYENNYNPYVQQFGRPQSPLIGPGPGRAVFHSTDQSRSHYMQPSANSFPGNTPMPPPGARVSMSDAARAGEGTPLSQNAFLRSVVDDESLVFRSHPLFPLLRDIIIADMNFHTPSFPFQLIANLPADFNRLVENYMQRNPQLSSVSVSDPHAESVVMDALAYAHAALIGEMATTEIYYYYYYYYVCFYYCMGLC